MSNFLFVLLWLLEVSPSFEYQKLLYIIAISHRESLGEIYYLGDLFTPSQTC